MRIVHTHPVVSDSRVNVNERFSIGNKERRYSVTAINVSFRLSGGSDNAEIQASSFIMRSICYCSCNNSFCRVIIIIFVLDSSVISNATKKLLILLLLLLSR